MQKTPILLFGCLVTCISLAAPIPILNPSGEINSGITPTLISDPSVIGD
jgi:hypothetical protein